MTLETLTLELLPPTWRVHAAFFKGVVNSEFLQEQLLGRNAEFEYAFIDASAIVSRQQVLSALFNVAVVAETGGLQTPNVHSEVVCSLSPGKNIAEAYRRWGITPGTTKDIIILKILTLEPKSECPTADDVWTHLRKHVDGRPVPLTDDEIDGSTDWAKVRKYYKLNGAPALEGIQDDAGRKKEAETLIITSMALRGL
ncbi:putative kinase [Diplogelasinospora grovesii]|uniref:EKC/KEOPS complex subunit CGI121 n=1 Tax=Diplogelasinospora grovesii TaxID=303347 RepID=A0AAN6N0R3_9PEZI|nr:putative kinase [Diplogelasinospora grovesii]